MPYTQLVQPDLTIVGKVGYCLEYARKMFHAPAVEPTAWKAWEAAQYKHPDRNYPVDASELLWFSYWLDGVNFGHVVVNVPGQGLYSSPYKSGTTHAVLSSIAEVERLYGAKYVGWSEDISKVRVIEGDFMTEAEYDAYARRILTLGMFLTVPGDAPDRQPTTQEVVDTINGLKSDPIAYIDYLTNTSPWGVAWNKVKHYDGDVKKAYDKGKAEGGGGNVPPGTYLKVNKADVIEVK